MTLNKQTGNMYPFVTHTWNPIKGKCPHECIYCYMKRFPVGKLRLDKKCLKDNLGKGNYIFVGSSTDMWAYDVPMKWITKVLEHCRKFPDNTYLFQSKNPLRFLIYDESEFPKNVVYGTTIETNRNLHIMTKVSMPFIRGRAINALCRRGKTMVSIEPILSFDLDDFVFLIQMIKPDFISIGADSKGSSISEIEPTPEKVEALITELKKFTEVKVKDNLRRLRK